MVARCREEEPDAIGVFVFGSHARGDATPTSDVDVRVITLGAPRVHYRTWFVGETHVSVGAASAEARRARAAEPAAWALGFAAHEPAVWLWQTAAAAAALGDPPEVTRPAAPPELEDFVEYAAKAFRAPDELGLRLAAQGVGREAIPLLLDLNPQAVVRTRREALDAARLLRVAPEGWPDDLLTLLGLAAGDVRAAVEHVAYGVLRLLREAGSRVGREQPDANRYLHDGTFERHLDRTRCYFEIP